VGYSIRSRTRIGKKMLTFVTLTFGGANAYYPNDGVQLTVNGLGMRSYIDAVIVLEDNAAGYQYQWDRSEKKLRMFFSATGTVNAELEDNAITAQTLEVMAIGG